MNWKDPLKYFFFCFRTASLGGSGLSLRTISLHVLARIAKLIYPPPPKKKEKRNIEERNKIHAPKKTAYLKVAAFKLSLLFWFPSSTAQVQKIHFWNLVITHEGALTD